ncbi:sugar phosphate isomerase/epimerase family protein [Spirillospora sp. NPDC047279]|uniref:sugar phosphate isomerase/epimerase family protein n=1 Tax=Spirillospora sp. NPDC047279 TaxID=3155478 RepID=UPI0033D165E0
MSAGPFSLNQWTTRYWPLPDLVAGCAGAGVTGVGLWREPVAEFGLARTAKLVREAGLAVTSLCRGGFFLERGALDDNRRAIEEAAELGAPVLVLVSGGLPDGPGARDVDGARQRVGDAIAELAPYAGQHGVRLAIEPLHPMFCSDRCVISTLGQALDLAERSPAEQVGVVVDTYHLWWDPHAYVDIARAGERIAIFQVADWVTPLPEGVLTGRGMLGDGCVELRRFRTAVEAAGYTGPVEVEIFNTGLWAMPGAEALGLVLERYAEHVA